MWSNQETSVRKQVENPCEAERYAMHSSGKNSLAVGLSPYKIAKKDAFASDMYPFYWTSSERGIFMRYSYEFKRKAVELYMQVRRISFSQSLE